MHDPQGTEYLAECFWPGVRDSDLMALDERANASAAEVSARGETVRYLGSLLMRDDEVVLCRFRGSEPAVRRVAEEAAIPFERILEVSHSPASGDAGV
ncbi:MAG: nickel-binding protein [Candidatus Dormibacteria bacterium]